MGNALGQQLGVECCTQVLTFDPDELSEEESVALNNEQAKSQLMGDSNTPNDDHINNITPTPTPNNLLNQGQNRLKISNFSSGRRSSSSRSRSGSHRSKTKGSYNTPTGEANYHYSPVHRIRHPDDIPSSDEDQIVEELKNIDEIEGIDINHTELTQTDHEMKEWFKKHKAENAKNLKDKSKSAPISNKDKKKKRKKSKARNKLKQMRSKKVNSNKQTIDELQDELSEIEIKLKQQLHEAEILKQENNALRQENYVLKNNSIQATQQNGYHVTNTKTIKHSHQIPPTPPITPYRMRSMKTNSCSPDVRPVSPVTISITNTTVSYQGSIKKMPSLELGAEVINTLHMDQLPGISPMVSQLPPMYGDMYSLTEEPNGTVGALSSPYGNTLGNNSTITPSTDTPQSQTLRASPILSYISANTHGQNVDDALDLGHDHTNDNVQLRLQPGHDSKEDKLLFKMGFNNGKCSGIDACISCKRIIKSLEWYYSFRDNPELLLERINKYDYGMYILHDYQHIMAYHLSIKSYTNNSNISDVEAQYERIRSLLTHECDVNQCKGFKRHKSRQSQSHNHDQSDVIMETLDQAHCYFLHLDS